MVSPFLVAVPATIIPAMIALWIHLKRYEGFFEDAKVFFFLITGFFVGLAVTAFETIAFPFADPLMVEAMGPWSAFAFFVVGYAFFETGAKVIVLGLGQFKGRKDTPYYGVALGLGFGAMASLLFVARGVNTLNTLQAQGADIPAFDVALSIGVAVMLPMGAIFAHGASAVWIGRESGEKNLFKGWLLGALTLMPILLCYWFWLAPRDVQDFSLWRAVLPAVAGLAYGIWLLHKARVSILEQIVPPQIRAQVRRDMRRQRRGEAMQGTTAPAMAAISPLPPPGDGLGPELDVIPDSDESE